MNKIYVMKTAVTIILLVCIIHSLGYIYKMILNEQHSENERHDVKLGKSLETTFEKIMSLNKN